MKLRVLTLLLVLVLALGLVPAVSAQGDDFFTCFDLPEEDCALLVTYTEAAQPTAFNVAVSMDLSLGGLAALGPMMGGGMGDVAVSMTGSGPMVVDETLTTFPPVSMMFDYDLIVSAAGEEQSFSQGIVILDGVFYMSDPESGEWIGMTFDDLMASAGLGSIFGGMGGELPEGALSPEALLGGDPTAMLAELGLPEGFDPMALLQLPGFLHMERLPDEAMMGQTMHVFSFTADTAPLFSSTEFQSLLSALLQQAAQADPSAAQMGMMLPGLLSGASIVFNETTWYGADDLYTHAVTMDLNITVDLNTLMPPSTSGGNTPQMEPITLTVHLEVQFDQFDQAFEITAPEGATMMSPDMMMEGSSGS